MTSRMQESSLSLSEGIIKQKRKKRLSKPWKVEQFRIIRQRRIAVSNKISALQPSFSIFTRTKLAAGSYIFRPGMERKMLQTLSLSEKINSFVCLIYASSVKSTLPAYSARELIVQGFFVSLIFSIRGLLPVRP